MDGFFIFDGTTVKTWKLSRDNCPVEVYHVIITDGWCVIKVTEKLLYKHWRRLKLISFPEQQWCRFSNSYLYTWANSANTDCILNTNLEPLLFQVGESKYEWMSFYLKVNQAIFVESFQFKLATLLYTLQYKYSSIAQSRPNRSEKVQRQDIKPGRIFNDLHLFSIQHFPYKFVHCVRSELKPLKLRNLSLVIKKGFVNLFWNVLLSQALH